MVRPNQVSSETRPDSPPEESKTCQEKVEGLINGAFANWGSVLSRHPCKVFWISILIMLAFCGGWAKRAGFEDESLIWTPAGNPSILA